MNRQTIGIGVLDSDKIALSWLYPGFNEVSTADVEQLLVKG
ncbi:hypothetical protein [Nitrosococcus halophilus]|nr:hypothetical protein [Nitrosococcus halophilus]